MTPLLMFIDPLLSWLDARCLTKLLMTGDQLLKHALQENVTELVQYYHADPVVDVWQFPSLALVSFPKLFRVVLVTDRDSYYEYHPLRRVDFKLLPSTVTDLVLKFGKVMSYSWAGVVLPNLRTVDIDLGNQSGELRPLPAFITSKLVNRYLPNSDNTVTGIKTIIAQTADAKKVKLLFSALGPIPSDVLDLNFSQHHQLSSLSLKSVSPIIDLFVLPRTLTELSATYCNLLNHATIELLPLNTLGLNHNVWYEEVRSNSDKRIARKHGSLAIACPSTVRTIFCAGSLYKHSSEVLHLPNSVTHVRYYTTTVSLDFYESDAILLGLLALDIDVGVTDAFGLSSALGVIRKSPNLQSTTIVVGTEELARSIIDVLNHYCPQLEKLNLSVLSLRSPGFATINRHYAPQVIPYSLVECIAPEMYYPESLLLTTNHINLHVLAISIDLANSEKFNQLLQSLRQLRYLELSLHFNFTGSPDSHYSFLLSAPSSLTDLTIRSSGMSSPSEINLVMRFTGEGGIPSKLRSIHLDGTDNITWSIDPQQTEILPTTLEESYPLPQSPTALARLFNLVVDNN